MPDTAREPGTYIELDDAWNDPGWTRVPNSIIRCAALSLAAKGLVAELASHVVGRRVTLDSLTASSTDGRDSVRARIGELEQAGFLTRRRERDSYGRLGVAIYRLHVTPQTSIETPASATPTVENPASVSPTLATAVTSNKTKVLEDQTPLISSNEEIISPRARTHARVGPGARAREATPGQDGHLPLDGLPAPVEAVVPINRKAEETFARFWTVYPLKKAKGDAWKAWPKAIKAADPDVIIAGVARYVTELRVTGAYTAYPATWLNGKRWEDEPVTVGNAGRLGGDRRGGGSRGEYQPYQQIHRDEADLAEACRTGAIFR